MFNKKTLVKPIDAQASMNSQDKPEGLLEEFHDGSNPFIGCTLCESFCGKPNISCPILMSTQMKGV